MRSSHILCKVHDLKTAVKDYQDLGFTVEWGDEPEKAINALIWFERGPFIELIDADAAQPPKAIAWLLGRFFPTGMIARFNHWQQMPEGWVELALETHGTDIQPEVKALKRRDFKISGPFTNKRRPPNGCLITTQTAFPHNMRLPILMGAYRPDPRPKSIFHANGAVGISCISFGYNPKDQRDWEQILDQNDPWLALESGRIGVGHVSLLGLREALPLEKTHGAVIVPG
ncbi:VOC family protein [Polycladidibacter hongkongensis]|uniref:VOC family protein n=1 Tax=Polycladidibacter hongkongensis TaxID=1647556 RepID=UPI00082B6AB7|nr:VOC family protein [Pseudovibrio hongkongensis]